MEKNDNFLINTENVRNKEDVRCNDDGSWINNGVRKIHSHIQNPANPKKAQNQSSSVVGKLKVIITGV